VTASDPIGDSDGKPRRAFGKRRVALADLTDEELLEEVQVRRRRRGAVPPADPGDAPSEEAGATLPLQVRQWLVNLELAPDAGIEDVERAYDRLLRRYGPMAKDVDAKRRAAARTLLAAFKRAHEGLQVHFSRER